MTPWTPVSESLLYTVSASTFSPPILTLGQTGWRASWACTQGEPWRACGGSQCQNRLHLCGGAGTIWVCRRPCTLGSTASPWPLLGCPKVLWREGMRRRHRRRQVWKHEDGFQRHWCGWRTYYSLGIDTINLWKASKNSWGKYLPILPLAYYLNVSVMSWNPYKLTFKCKQAESKHNVQQSDLSHIFHAKTYYSPLAVPNNGVLQEVFLDGHSINIPIFISVGTVSQTMPSRSVFNTFISSQNENLSTVCF